MQGLITILLLKVFSKLRENLRHEIPDQQEWQWNESSCMESELNEIEPQHREPVDGDGWGVWPRRLSKGPDWAVGQRVKRGVASSHYQSPSGVSVGLLFGPLMDSNESMTVIPHPHTSLPPFWLFLTSSHPTHPSAGSIKHSVADGLNQQLLSMKDTVIVWSSPEVFRVVRLKWVSFILSPFLGNVCSRGQASSTADLRLSCTVELLKRASILLKDRSWKERARPVTDE